MTFAPQPKPSPRILDKALSKREDARQEREARKAVVAREKGRCRCCGARGNHLHHLRYRSRGGTWDTKALMWTCVSCHALIHARVILVMWTNADLSDGVTFDMGK